jgi:hypothetical protein
MDTTTQNTHAIMDDMVTLRIQLAAIASQLESLKPAFFSALQISKTIGLTDNVLESGIVILNVE